MKCCFISQQASQKIYKYKSNIISKSRSTNLCSRHQMAPRPSVVYFIAEDYGVTKSQHQKPVWNDRPRLNNIGSVSWISRIVSAEGSSSFNIHSKMRFGSKQELPLVCLLSCLLAVFCCICYWLFFNETQTCKMSEKCMRLMKNDQKHMKLSYGFFKVLKTEVAVATWGDYRVTAHWSSLHLPKILMLL